MKRVFDVTVALFVLILVAPLLLAITIAVAATSHGGALYRAQRIGRGGTPFTMLKFRTMVANADRIGSLITCRGDSRVTRLGRGLRWTKLDELPELWNVVRGDMALVGPRPENPETVSQYSVAQRAILRVRPGVTSPATIKYRHEERLLGGSAGVEERYFTLMQEKLALDAEYLRTRSFLTDLKVLLTTALMLFR